MRLIGYILLICVVIAALQWAVLALFIVAIVAWAVALIQNPRDTLTFLGGVAVLSAFNEHPLIFVGSLGAMMIISLIIRGR